MKRKLRYQLQTINTNDETDVKQKIYHLYSDEIKYVASAVENFPYVEFDDFYGLVNSGADIAKEILGEDEFKECKSYGICLNTGTTDLDKNTATMIVSF